MKEMLTIDRQYCDVILSPWIYAIHYITDRTMWAVISWLWPLKIWFTVNVNYCGLYLIIWSTKMTYFFIWITTNYWEDWQYTDFYYCDRSFSFVCTRKIINGQIVHYNTNQRNGDPNLTENKTDYIILGY